MNVEELNTELEEFFFKYEDNRTGSLVLLAEKCNQHIEEHYSQDAINRYKSLSKDSFDGEVRLDTTYLYQQELQLQAKVERFKKILEAQSNLSSKLLAELEQTKKDIKDWKDIPGKIEQLEKSFNAVPTEGQRAIRNHIVQMRFKEEFSESKIKSLEDKKQRLVANQKFADGIKTLTPATSKPINLDKLPFLHSIKGVFRLDDKFNEIKTAEELKQEMVMIQKQTAAAAGNDQKRLDAMNELMLYYSDFVKDSSPTQVFNLGIQHKIKSITVDSPQTYSRIDPEKSASFSIPKDTCCLMPEGHSIQCSNKVTIRIAFDNGAKIFLLPGGAAGEPKVFLPARTSFEHGDLGEEAYRASVKIFVEAYLEKDKGEQITLSFNNMSTKEKKYLREEIIRTLLFLKAEQVQGGKVVIKDAAVKRIQFTTASLFNDDDDDDAKEDFWRDYLDKSQRTWKEYVLGSSASTEQLNQEKARILEKAESIFLKEMSPDETPKSCLQPVYNAYNNTRAYICDSEEATKAKALAATIKFLATHNPKDKEYDTKKEELQEYLSARHFNTMAGGKNNTGISPELSSTIEKWKKLYEDTEIPKSCQRKGL